MDKKKKLEELKIRREIEVAEYKSFKIDRGENYDEKELEDYIKKGNVR